MKRRHRLRKSRDFARLREEGERWVGRYFVVSVLVFPEEREFAAGVITGKRLGNAVCRNRLRRRVRAIVDRRAEELKCGTRFVTVVRAAAVGAAFGSLESEWNRLARRAGLLREPTPPAS